MIKLIKGYKYDNKYDYIKLFSSKKKQNEYFNTFDSIFIDENEYIKEGESFNVPFNYDFLKSEGINYLIFNNGYEDLYCFITKKEYLNEEVTRLHYEIDVLNTYIFKIEIKNSYVERKNCTVNEITDFDEGIEVGEHKIESTITTLEKKYKWFAMFSGIKQQQLVFNNNVLTNVIDLPSPTMKPLTIIDGVQYPLHFMELKERYEQYTISKVEGTGSGGNTELNKGILSAKGFRFIKGFEGFAPNPYQDSGGYWTIAYGITKHGESDIYNDLVSKAPVSEEEGAKISYKLKNERYALKIVDRCKELGITTQNQFDALCSLAYNGGVGSVTLDNELTKAIKLNPLNENVIRPIWETFKITSNGQVLEGLKARRKDECNLYFGKSVTMRKIALIDERGVINGHVAENNGNGWLPE